MKKKSPPISSIAVANFFYEKAKKVDKKITPLQIIKLVYFSHAWSLALRGEPLITEKVEAWKYGPVIRKVYNEFKEFGGGAITRFGSEFIDDGSDFNDENEIFSIIPVVKDENHIKLLNAVWNSYHHLTGIQLSALEHKNGTPWSQSFKPNQYVIISDEIIKQFYLKQINKTK